MRAARLRVMGTDAHVVVVGGSDHLLGHAARQLVDLESKWSRFRRDSELNRVNLHGGAPVRVSEATLLAVEVAIAAWRDTGGRFDPTVGAALEAIGYDRPFATVEPDAVPAARPTRPPPGCHGIVIDRIVSAITVPPGTRLDLGGIGKGLAADLTAASLMAHGAAGALVNVGGDLLAIGEPPDGNGWTIAMHRELGSITIREGGVATSAVTERRWRRGGVAHHHVIDPATGASARATPDWVTVLAPSAAAAEVLATVALLGGDHTTDLLDAWDADGIAEYADGRLVASGALAPLAGVPA